MRFITWILQMSRLLVAVTLIAGPTGPVYAGLSGTPSPSYKEEAAVQPLAANTVRVQAPSAQDHLKVPMYFEANIGQTDAAVKFFTRAAGYNLYLTASEAVTVLHRTEADKAKGSPIVRMQLKGANAKPAVQGQGILPGRTSYYLGNDSSKWQTGVKQYSRVSFSQVYPGIDMVYRFDKGTVEYDFVVSPGANPGRILMGFKGTKDIRLDTKGNLVLNVEGGELTYKAPQLYQTLGTKRVSVKGRFVLASNNNVRFEVGNYVKSKALVIDPEIHYSTYLGGADDDAINGLAVDSLGEAYVTGWSISAMSGLGGPGFPPATTTYPTTATIGTGTGREVFVAKLSGDGATLRWLVWLGGALADEAKAIALEKTTSSSPKIYITGVTNSPTFPVAGPTIQVCTDITGDGTTSKAFVAELSQLGSPASPALVYSTCLGGVAAPGKNSGNAIAVDATGAAYVTGTTFASDFAISFGIPAPYNLFGGSEDAFVVKIPEGAIGGAVSYSMLLGPNSGITNGNAIAVDTVNKAWVGGRTTSGSWPSATGGGTGVFNHHFASAIVGASDAFIVKVNATGTGLDYATYINGDNDESVVAIALNHGGVPPYHVFVAGDTNSDTDFPSTAYYNLPAATRAAVWQKDIVGGAQYHPFVLRLNPDEPAVLTPTNPLEVVYATHLGSPNASIDHVLALALDSRDDAYIAGYTFGIAWVVDPTADYLTDCTGACVMINPVLGPSGSARSNTSTLQDGFVVAVGSTGQSQPFMSYLGASAGTANRQAASAIAIDANHNIYVAGYTPSTDFPLTTGSLMDGTVPLKQLNRNFTGGKMDGFVMKIDPVLSFGAPLVPTVPAVACNITSISPNSGYTAGGDTVTITGTDLYGFPSGGVTVDGVAVSSYTMYASSGVLTAVIPRHPLVGALVPGLTLFTLTNSTGACSVNYTYVSSAAACNITSISPNSGYTTGGDTVTITGTDLYGFSASSVTVDGVAVSSYTMYASSGVLTAVIPRHPLVGTLAPGLTLFTLTNSTGACSANYTYIASVASCTITSISPGFGYAVGGTTVTITGTGFFGLAVPANVAFGANNAASYTVNLASTVVTAISPRHPALGTLTAGTVLLTLATSSGTCSVNYAYLAGSGPCGDDMFYPSPATGTTGTFSYCMALAGTARIKIYNVIGDLVAKLEDARAAGGATSTLNTGRLAPGVYLYRLEKDYGGGNSDTSKVLKFAVVR